MPIVTLLGTRPCHERFPRLRRLRTRLWHVILPIVFFVVAVRRPWNVLRQAAFWAHATHQHPQDALQSFNDVVEPR